MKAGTLLACVLAAATPALAEPAPPALRIELAGPVEDAITGGWHACERTDLPDAPVRAIRLSDGSVQLYASDQVNRVNTGPDLNHLHHDCTIVFQGGGNDDPAAFDDHAWIASPWTEDGRTVWAIIHDEFHGNDRPWLCPTGRYMDCWYNALTLAVSHDGGHQFERAPGQALVAALPYRYDQVGRGHHGYFNPSNIQPAFGGLVMLAFATEAGAQRPGNCLLRADDIADPRSWRGWDGHAFTSRFVDPYVDNGDPAQHVCAPVGAGALRWPVTGLVRHAPTGLYIAVMQDASEDGGVYYATSSDLITWSAPALLHKATGLVHWNCGDPAPIAYPAILDPDAADDNFQTVGATAALFETRFGIDTCKVAYSRNLIRQYLKISRP